MADVFGRLAARLKTPRAVQDFLRGSPYNREKGGETLRSARAALKFGQAHCLEAAFIAAAILERHGYPPLVMSMESQDGLDHVLYVFQQNGRWGAIGRSRDEGLHGRAPVYKSLRDLCWSYYDPYVDKVGKIIGYQVYHLDESGSDWRHGDKNIWKVETDLIKIKHHKIKSSKSRYKKLLRNYLKNGPLTSGRHWW